MKLPIWFKQLELGPMQNYVYLLGDPTTKEAAVVDAAWDIDTILNTAEADGYRITSNLVTHFHPDHLGGSLMGHPISGIADLLERESVPVHVQEQEVEWVTRSTGVGTDHLVAHGVDGDVLVDVPVGLACRDQGGDGGGAPRLGVLVDQVGPERMGGGLHGVVGGCRLDEPGQQVGDLLQRARSGRLACPSRLGGLGELLQVED